MVCIQFNRRLLSNSQIIQSQTVDIPQSIKDSLRKFRFARRNAGSAALVFKINKAKLIVEEVEQFDDISIEDLADGPYAISVPMID
jgi:hypothetical protein